MHSLNRFLKAFKEVYNFTPDMEAMHVKVEKSKATCR